MLRRYVTADVFAERMFGGNPLAVVLDAEGLTTAQMQSAASAQACRNRQCACTCSSHLKCASSQRERKAR